MSRVIYTLIETAFVWLQQTSILQLQRNLFKHFFAIPTKKIFQFLNVLADTSSHSKARIILSENWTFSRLK